MTNAELISRVRSIAKHGADWRINEVLNRAADALEAADERIAELMPKEGEWIMDGKYNRHCSRCNEDVVWSFNYCPNCGARMRTVTECHALEER